MKRSVAARRVVPVFAMAVFMAGCGGGGESGSGGVAGSVAGVRTGAAMNAPAPLTAAQLMAWAEVNFSQFFPASSKQEAFSPPFTYRFYPATRNYLGVSTEPADVAIYTLGEIGGGQLRRIAPLSDFTCTVLPQNCEGEAGSLNGHTISTTDFHGAAPDHTQILGPRNTVAGDAVELSNEFFGGFATIDFSASTIRITAATDQPFGYFELLRFADTHGTISRIASITVDPATNYAGFDASRLQITASTIDINLTGLSGQRGQQILLNIVFAAP